VTGLANYIVETLWEDEEFVLSRRVWDDRPSSLLVSTPASAQPTVETVARLDRAYALRDELDSAWAARPVALESEDGRSALLIEDPGGEVLARMVGTPWDLKPFLHVAIGLAVSLGRLHNRGFIHKDVKPSNILVKIDTFNLWLVGFGIASRLSRERRAPEPPEIIAGTLAYMAPEQTGRMNRSIDARSDLYSLGITLYEMLTGKLPFTASDPMEWIHCHIARQPMPPDERVKEIPAPIAAIVMKLLAKTAEDRYQTAAGVESDLRRCLAEWEPHGRINPFAPGQDDTPDRLLIPEKLYGRAREVDTLLASFDRIVKSGKPELVLVSGYSGIGKSAVVNELHKPLVAPRGLFASGKFDQYKRDIPYATLAQAFRSLIRPLLSKREEELSKWRNALHEALAPNGQLMVDLVPELKAVIGEQRPVPELPQQEAQHRFHLVFRRFINVFARPEHPLALFLDDLQWLDAATLDLIEDLLTQPDVKHLLLIGAYRDNEVDPTHPLVRKLQAMRQAGALLQDIVLAPLTREDLDQLIADSLHCEPAYAGPLAELVHDKTTGNPFFAIQFISALAEEALLTFDHSRRRWSWDLSRIQAKGYTDNVVDLMVGKLNRLPVEALKALKEFACLGNSAEITTLCIVQGTSEEEVHSDLWEALRLEFISRLESSYKFVHDRVQEAAYSQIPERLRAEAHLRIGRLLAANTPQDKLEETIFEIVNQFNRGTALITSPDECEQLAELNLIAGKRAKAATAYKSALKYLIAGAALLASDVWTRRYDLAFALQLHRAECEFLTGELATAEKRLTMLASRAANTVERATVESLRIDLYTVLDQTARVVTACLDYLRHLGVEWSPHPTEEEARREYERIWSLLGSRAIEELIELPLMSDPASLATLDVLTKVFPTATLTDANLLSMAVCRVINLSLERGNSDASCVAYVHFGTIAGPRFGDYKAGFRFGQLGYDLVEKRGLNRFKARTYHWLAQYVLPWTKHPKACRGLTRRAFEAATKVGDLSIAVYSLDILNTNFLAAGAPLVEAQSQAENGLELTKKTRFGHQIDVQATQLGLIKTLRGLTYKFGWFDDGQYSEALVEKRFTPHPAVYWIRKLQARFFAGDYPAALDAAARARPKLWTLAAMFEEAEYHFYAALSHAASCASAVSDHDGPTSSRPAEDVPPSSPATEDQLHFEALAAHHGQLEVWAENCSENFENRAALVGAEIARIEGRVLEAEQLYERAIRSARSNGFVHNEAIAYEVAARFYAARGFQKFADAYSIEARHCYQRWGADGKVAQLDRLYPHLKKEGLISRPTSTILAPTELLDLATVIKVSQAVSGEMVLEKLTDSLMRTAIEHAGAERGLLMLSRGDELRIAAEATTSGDTVIVNPREASAAAAALPESIVQYVVRAQESVILNDASAENPFSADAYVRQHHARSILCLPLINRAKLIGMLYLENNLTPHVFTPARIAVLEPLASQAAISLENARLYRDAQQMEAFLKAAQALSHTGSFGWRPATGEIVWSEETHQIIGYDRGTKPTLELVFQRIHPEDIVFVQEAVDRSTLNGTDLDFEHRFLLPDGSVKFVHVVARAVRDESGNIEYVGAIMDITERKQAEDALRKSQGELAHVARVMTMGELAASIAHEVNQPLASVINSATACLRWLDAQRLEEARRSASRVIADGHRASEIIGRIRALAKKAPPHMDWLDVNETILEVIALARSEMQRSGVVLETQLSEHVPVILADRVQLQQVILNLMMNAIEAMNGVGEGLRELLVGSGADESKHVVISVQDSGPGFDPNSLEHLFDAFYTTKPHGLGMGLSISRSIIEAHGGRLWAAANVPCGAVFQFTLPIGSERVT
jgi:PAS domain S-box-containing protein